MDSLPTASEWEVVGAVVYGGNGGRMSDEALRNSYLEHRVCELQADLVLITEVERTVPYPKVVLYRKKRAEP